ncbi:amino acid dehydrogenase [Sphingomonas sp. MG17]|uniref:Amino acid dehydrogenase n=1 Tax=Sphingomonas tagetis TaxID=2949092 RepID=A0A9X2HJ42_9SPHN|nr:Glu/Leu/Phe/Val dehydrogenase dimerization domain-containing protein [Sphingomonas tagetis]MCP3732136.1 amino acid dehydrogenase [Sphingomonas tagetis]
MVHLRTAGAAVPERLHVIDDQASGMFGVIVVDSTVRGPAAGGFRLLPYESEAAAVQAAVRSARGVTYKHALPNLPFGGGQAVLRVPDRAFDRTPALRVLADALANLKGGYIITPHFGDDIVDIAALRRRTSYIADNRFTLQRSGDDASRWTALGVFRSMEAAAKQALNASLSALRVGVLSVSGVGAELCRLPHHAGVRLAIADQNSVHVRRLAEGTNATIFSPEGLVGAQLDIFAPCGGGILNAPNISLLQAHLVCGAAENQPASDEDGLALFRRGIVVAPDYLVNIGGILGAAASHLGETCRQLQDRIEQIPARLLQVLAAADRSGEPPHRVADQMAEAAVCNRRLVA